MRRTPLRSRSRKRETVMRKRRLFVASYLAVHPDCVRCNMTADDIHEPLTRARGGAILDDANSLPVCRTCHSWIHDNVAEATDLGWLVPSWQASA